MRIATREVDVPSDLYSDLLSLPAEFPGMDKIPSPIVYLMGCSKFDQFCCTLRALIDPTDFCPFCGIERARRTGISVDHDGWLLLANDFPRTDVSQMWLIVPKAHLTTPEHMVASDWVAVGLLLNHCRRKAGINGGGLLMRFGDPHLHAGTMEHIHINVIEPVCGQEFRPPLAKTPEKHEKDYVRLIEHRYQLFDAGGEPWLFSKEGVTSTRPN